MYESSWMVKDARGAERRGCMACGAHVLLGGPAVPRCRCCGSQDLCSVADAAVAQRGRASVRRGPPPASAASPVTVKA
jgi:hypothetical protein